MYFMYVDESGDPGLPPQSPTNFFVLTGVVVHETAWHSVLDRMYRFRRRMRAKYGFNMREEIHTTRMFGRGDKRNLSVKSPNDRLSIYRLFLREIAATPELSIINVIVDKSLSE